MAASVRWPVPSPVPGQPVAGSAVARVQYEEPLAAWRLAGAIRACLAEPAVGRRPWTVVCVGTDRSTGDALGPLVGDILARGGDERLRVYGTLESPVHATNLADVLRQIRLDGGGGPIIAVDACLGQASHVGTVSVRRGPLHPGTGVNKTLPAVGDIHLVGVVNVGGFMEYFVLQNTRLHLVSRMAEVIATSLLTAVAVPSRQEWTPTPLDALPGSGSDEWGVVKDAQKEAAGGRDTPWIALDPPPG